MATVMMVPVAFFFFWELSGFLCVGCQRNALISSSVMQKASRDREHSNLSKRMRKDDISGKTNI
jgi:hypothetical protein